MDVWVIGTLNQLFKRGSYSPIKKGKYLVAKLRSLLLVHFVHPTQFVLALAFDREVLYGNITLSIEVRSTKKWYFNFLKKVLVFQKTCFKVKVLETL